MTALIFLIIKKISDMYYSEDQILKVKNLEE